MVIKHGHRILLVIVNMLIFYTIANLSYASNFSTTSHRDDSWEVTLQTKYIDSTKIDFQGGAKAELNEEWAWGFGLGYNFDKNWAFNFDINWTNVGYKGTRIDDDGSSIPVTGTISTSSSNFSSIYYFSHKRFTPYVGASLGWIFIDSNIANGPPQTTCWWDPWWGYICSDYQPTNTTTEFTYGINLGMRFELNRQLFLRANVARSWADFDKSNGTPQLDSVRFDIGIMF